MNVKRTKVIKWGPHNNSSSPTHSVPLLKMPVTVDIIRSIIMIMIFVRVLLLRCLDFISIVHAAQVVFVRVVLHEIREVHLAQAGETVLHIACLYFLADY